MKISKNVQFTLLQQINKISANSLRPQTFRDKNLLTPMLAVCDAVPFFHLLYNLTNYGCLFRKF